jgi:CRP-like cAMP-binding protein
MELFRGLPREALAEVLDRGTVRRLARNTVIFAQGQVATRCHALIDGRVRITQSDEDGTELLVRFIGPGQMFGTVALFTNGEYPAEAVAVLESVEISWPQAALLELIGRFPQIALNIVRVIGVRLREVQERLRELASQRVERRIAHALLRLAAQAGRPVGDGTTIDFPLTRKDLADMCGATLHTVSRIMTAWERSGLIGSRRQRVSIHDPAAIQRIAEDAVVRSED